MVPVENVPLIQTVPHIMSLGRLKGVTFHVHIQDIDEAEGVRAVHEAFRLGINYFDTSPFYGETRSEQARRRKRRTAIQKTRLSCVLGAAY